jgi:hypothetical protein
MSRTNDRARAALTDATVTATYIDAAMNALRDARGGYPSSTPGAGPSSSITTHDPDGDTTLTATERQATTPDPAANDLRRLIEAVRQAQHHQAIAATIAARWGAPALSDSDVATRLATIDQGIWCNNCARHGQRNPRREGKAQCEFCLSFKQSFGLAASKAIWDARDARGGRIYVQDIERILDRDSPGWRKNRPKPKLKGGAA